MSKIKEPTIKPTVEEVNSLLEAGLITPEFAEKKLAEIARREKAKISRAKHKASNMPKRAEQQKIFQNFLNKMYMAAAIAKAKARKEKEELETKITEMVKEGKSNFDISLEVGLTPFDVYKVKRRLKLNTKTQGEENGK